MKRKLIVFLFFALFLSTNVKAQCDPWIVNAYNLICKRAPTTSECTITNYNNGSWSSYAQLVSLVYNYVGPLKGDAWIIQAYYELYQRVPIAPELNIQNYNRGSWSSYANLKSYISIYINAMLSQNIGYKLARNDKGNIIVAYIDKATGKEIAIDEILARYASIVAGGGGNIVAGGGGNLTSVNIGNIIAATSFNLPPGGGASITLSQVQGLFYPATLTVLSADTKKITTSGTGYMYFK